MTTSGSGKDPISRQAMTLRDHTLLEGAMAAGALVALADRRLKIEETIALEMVVKNVEQLRIHTPKVAIGMYSRYVDHLRTDPESGRKAAMEAISRCREDIAAAELIVRIGIAVAKADRDFTADEQRMIEEICRCVGIQGLDAPTLAGLPGGGPVAEG